jgi:hypothetical protein
MILKNITKLEKTLWKEIVEYVGVDNEMANFVAQDRNDVITCKELLQAGKITALRNKVNHLDTFIRDGVVLALAKDLGDEWVSNALGYEVR